jgi:Phosphatidylglycerophosphate synthase
MEKSIFRTVFTYFVLQLACIFFIGKRLGTAIPLLLFYAAASLVLHVGLYLFLMLFRTSFFNLSTNQPLNRINAANKLTLLRISFLPAVALLLQHKDIGQIKVVVPVVLILVFLTDAFDGLIARKGKQITRMGQMLDSISDYFLLAAITAVYYWHEIVPRWFLWLVFCRLFLQALGMLVFILIKKPVETKSTWGGKITIATTMSLYVLELVRLYLPENTAPFFRIMEYASGLVILALSFEKAGIFFRQGIRLKQEGKNR